MHVEACNKASQIYNMTWCINLKRFTKEKLHLINLQNQREMVFVWSIFCFGSILCLCLFCLCWHLVCCIVSSEHLFRCFCVCLCLHLVKVKPKVHCRRRISIFSTCSFSVIIRNYTKNLTLEIKPYAASENQSQSI